MELSRVLFAEDNDNDAELTIAALEEHNLANEVVRVRDGAEALDYLYLRNKYKDRPPGNPALLLLDLKMPKIDGVEVLKQVRSDENLKMVPVVILTSSREEKDLIESYKLSVNAYVVKPVEFGEFVEAVKQLGSFWALFNEPPPGTMK